MPVYVALRCQVNGARMTLIYALRHESMSSLILGPRQYGTSPVYCLVRAWIIERGEWLEGFQLLVYKPGKEWFTQPETSGNTL